MPDIPVVAVHTLHAFLATATEPLAGKAAADLKPQLRDKRARYGAARLWQWSIMPALESLVIEALRRNAVGLRIGRLVQQVRGTLTEVGEGWVEVGALAKTGAQSVERNIEQQLAVLGTGQADAPTEGTAADAFEQVLNAMSKLEKLRGGQPLDIPVRGSLALHAKNVISATVSELRAAAQRRADEVIDEAMKQRRVLSPDEFDRRVFDRTAIGNAIQEIAEELSTHLDKRLTLVAEDLAADLHRVVVRGQAGSLLRPAANWVKGGGVVAALGAGLIAFGVVAAPAIVGSLIAVSVLGAVANGWLRKRAITRQETALASARADAAKAVNEEFFDLQRRLLAQFMTELRAAVVDRVDGTVKSALTLRHIAHIAGCQQMIAVKALARVAERGDPIKVLREAARQCENRTS